MLPRTRDPHKGLRRCETFIRAAGPARSIGMGLADDLGLLLLRTLPLVSAGAWILAGAWRVRRRHVLSPLEIALTLFSLSLGGWILVDWLRYGLLYRTTAEVAVAVSLAGIALLTAAPLLVLLVTKWLTIGHSRYDPLLVVPSAAGVLGIAFGGFVRVEPVWWGMSVVVDPVRFLPWAGVLLGYTIAAVSFVSVLKSQRREMDPEARALFRWIEGSFLVAFALGVAATLILVLVSPGGVPFFSSTLVVPAVMHLRATIPVTPEQLSRLRRSLSELDKRVIAAYMFGRDGTPLASLGSGGNERVEPERMQALLAAVRSFVETSIPGSRGFAVTAMRFDAEGVVGVSGQYLIAAAVYTGPAYDAVRSELVRIVRDFESRHWRELAAPGGADALAEAGADALARLMR